ncbi:uncharacterized protein LOC125507659 [Triticum urartu]|uniref:F-box protein AT5G49610-like beta-propeller domain-containing protein n=1 Tax=Triticum urartu TaxID=4572 RepID=A0A8R7QLF6_TRIUA|nr:uncharacterized protein LOC125507654 [Triticum urartu]XP_048528125.1 uncharacterized protein LOC125507659 [Triticum urartu]
MAAVALPPAKPPSISSTTMTTTTTTTATAADGTTTTTLIASAAGGTTAITTTTTIKTTSAADGTTTITTTTITTTAPPTTSAVATTTVSSLGQDQLVEIFLRLPNLPALIRAALTCRSWLGAVRSSPSFRRLFRVLHRTPPIGLFLNIDGAATPSFVPLRRSDPEVTAALRRGDFFLTSLPVKAGTLTTWGVMDCRDGYILLWNKLDRPSVDKPSVAVVNPMTWAVDIIPLPGNVKAGKRRNFAFLGFHLLCSDEKPSSFGVVCVCGDKLRVRLAVFSSETWDWVVHPWVEIYGRKNLKFGSGTLVDGSVYWPFHGEGRMIRIDTATMDITSVDLPPQVTVEGCNFMAGETKDAQLCIVYASDDFALHVWTRGVDGDGIEIWMPQKTIGLSEIDRITMDLEGDLEVVQVRSGCVYLSTTCMTPVGTFRCWFFSLSLETMELELLVEGCFDGGACPYIMAWPPCLVGDDGSIGHEVEGSQ